MANILSDVKKIILLWNIIFEDENIICEIEEIMFYDVLTWR